MSVLVSMATYRSERQMGIRKYINPLGRWRGPRGRELLPVHPRMNM